ncbi:putative F-box domain-containing protein [Rosa chinensis]|uniref:Putative F-box domain-containing protein n=1 Tax=Rosa chinensis TaxID=74649 RepID=A0A2P6Q0S4_ROSCH|nr:F-box protein GID2 [Rosa chinensis]PRQ27774.1 putative F-box domain-containing protein [Rosa chinensis]
MKRGLSMAEEGDNKMKKLKVEEEEEDKIEQQQEEEVVIVQGPGFTNLDDNLIFEVFKHVDARTLGMASCVSKQWHKTAQDERLWELICTRHWANIGCGNQQLRSVVLALGGFRRLHSLYIWPLTKPSPSSLSSLSSSSSSWAAPLKPMVAAKPHARWGKDEVNLSLSLLSIRFYEKMNYSNRGPGR